MPFDDDGEKDHQEPMEPDLPSLPHDHLDFGKLQAMAAELRKDELGSAIASVI